MRALLRFLAASAVLAACACSRDVDTISPSDRLEMRPWVERSGSVFVGLLMDADFRWTCIGGGLAACTIQLRFRPIHYLKGSGGFGPRTVEVTMLTGEFRWVESNGRGLGRLSPGFFGLNDSYVVVAEETGVAKEGHGQFRVNSDLQIWRATPENVAVVTEILREGATSIGTSRDRRRPCLTEPAPSRRRRPSRRRGSARIRSSAAPGRGR